MRDLLTIAHLTLHEALRRRILLAALVCGLAFLALYGTGIHFIVREVQREAGGAVQARLALNFITLAGLYAAHFLAVMAAVLLPVDTLSGEIASGVAQTLASKPVRRSSIVLGKWLAYGAVAAAYLLLLAGGVVALSRMVAGFALPGVGAGLALMALETLIMVSLSFAGGARFSTITNGIVVFGLFGLAFIGGWMEQIGTLLGNEAARYVGTVASLIMPAESMWQLAAAVMQPSIMRETGMTPFSPASVPSPAMVVWAAGYVVAMVLLAVHAFRRRAL